MHQEGERRVLWRAMVVALLVLAACGGDDAGTTGLAARVDSAESTATTDSDETDGGDTDGDESETTETTGSGPDPTDDPDPETTEQVETTETTESERPIRSPEEEERWLLYLDRDGRPLMHPGGFGPFPFGTDVDIVLRDAEEAGMRIPRDTGWIKMSDVCADAADEDFRQIRFEFPRVELSFTPTGGLVDWFVDEEFSQLQVAFEGVGIGSTVADVESAYGSRLDTDGIEPVFELDPGAGGIFVVDGMIGLTDSVDDGGVVTSMWAGPGGCRRIFS